MAAPVLLGAVARIPLGVLTDRYGGHLGSTTLLLILLAPTALAGVAMSYDALLGASFLLGLAGASCAVGVPYVAQWFRPENQGLALGIYGMGNVGTAIASILAPRVAESYGWPVAFWMFLPTLVVMLPSSGCLDRMRRVLSRAELGWSIDLPCSVGVLSPGFSRSSTS